MVNFGYAAIAVIGTGKHHFGSRPGRVSRGAPTFLTFAGGWFLGSRHSISATDSISLNPGPSAGSQYDIRQRAPAAAGSVVAFRQPSIRRIDHDECGSPLVLIPDGAALLIVHAAVIDRDALCRQDVHRRSDRGGRRANHGADDYRGRDRMIPVAVVLVDIDIDVPVDVDVIDAGTAHIPGADIGSVVIGLHVRPGSAAGSSATSATATTPSGFRQRS